MKDLEKLVPVAVAGLVLAGAGTVDARAEGEVLAENTTPDDITPKTSEVDPTKESAAAPSTDIVSVAPTETTTDTETGVTTTVGDVNPRHDTETDEVSTDGRITATETPDPEGPTEVRGEPTPSGPAVITPNPDGGSTSTTPTEVKVTETENSTIEIEGDITPKDPVVTKPTEEETKDLDEALNNNEKDEDGNVTKVDLSGITVRDDDEENPTAGETFGGFEAVSKTNSVNENYEDKDGRTGTQTTTTVTFEKVVTNTEDKHLSTDDGSGEGYGELGKIVNEMFGLKNVEFTKLDDGSLSYVKDGETVVVKVAEDYSTETQTTTYKILVSQTKTTLTEKTESGSTVLGEGGTIIYNPVDEDKDDPAVVDKFIDFIKDALETEKKLNGAVPVQNADGSITAGNRKYVITEEETPISADDLAELKKSDPARLAALLNTGCEEGEEKVVVNDKGEVVTRVGGYAVTFVTNELTGKTVVRSIAVYELSKVEGAEETTKPDDMMVNPEAEAVLEAVGKAIEGDGLTADDVTDTKIEFIEGGYKVTVTATVTVDGEEVEKTFTYTVKSSTGGGTEPWKADKLGEKYASGSTTTITGEAHVEGETIVWSGTETSEKVTVTVNKETGSVSLDVKAEVGENFDGAIVESVTKNDDGTITVVTKATGKNDEDQDTVTTKTYTFSLGTMTPEEKAKFMQDNGLTGDGTAILTGLSKVTWTIDETIKTTIPNGDVEEKPDTSKSGQEANVGSVGAITGLEKKGDTYRYDGVTLTKDTAKSTADKTVYTGTTADGKTTYTIEETKVPLADITQAEIVELIAQNYTVPSGSTLESIDRTKGIAVYKNGSETITINFSGLSKTNVTLTTTIESPQFESTESKAAVQAQIAAWAKAQADKYGSIKLGDYEITSEMTLEEIGTIVEKLPDEAINKDIDFSEITGDKLKETLEGLEKNGTSYMPSTPGSKYGQWVYGGTELADNVREFYGVAYIKDRDGKWYQAVVKYGRGGPHYERTGLGYEEDGQNYINIPIPKDYLGSFNTELGHIDLVADSTLTTDDGEKDCILLNDVQIILTKTAADMANGTNLDDKAKLAGSIDWDNQDGVGDGFWQYDRADDLSQDYVDRGNKFYKVTGTVAYGLVEYDSERAAKRAKDSGLIIGYVEVPKVVNGEDTGEKVYKGYTETAILTTYGYLGAENNACHNDYDIKLGNLKLLKGGEKVTSINEEVEIYSSKVTATSTITTAINKLIFGNIVTVTTKDKVEIATRQEVENAFTGAWTITQTRNATDLKETDPNSEEQPWKYAASQKFSYDTYQKWVEKVGTKVSFTSSGTRYSGTLGYKYVIPASEQLGDIVINLDDGASTKTVTAERKIDAKLSATTTSTKTEPGKPIVVVTPPTTTPGGNNPGGGGGNPGGGNPGGGGGDETVIVDEEVPLTDLPDEVDIVDEDVPLTDLPDEVDIVDEDVPLVDIPDEDVPLANVPKTGDSFLVEALATMAAASSAAWLAMNKKRKA